MKVRIENRPRRFLQLTRIENVIIARLNNPAKHNVFTAQMIKELLHFFATDFQSMGIRCVILRGKGPSFCAGADMNYMRSMVEHNEAENYDDALDHARLFESIANARVITIGVAHGYVYAEGIGILAACDIVVAEEDTEFCFAEVLRGVAPAVMSPVVIARIGYSNARRYFLTGEKFSARRAFKMNLVQETGTQDEIELLLENWVQAINSGGPKAQLSIKKMLNAHIQFSAETTSEAWSVSPDRRNFLAGLTARLRVSEEGQEGFRAFFEKRAPDWAVRTEEE